MLLETYNFILLKNSIKILFIPNNPQIERELLTSGVIFAIIKETHTSDTDIKILRYIPLHIENSITQI